MKNANQWKLTIYRKNSQSSSTFRTTLSYKNIKTIDEVFQIIENVVGNDVKYYKGNKFYDGVKLAYWNNKLIVRNGYKLKIK